MMIQNAIVTPDGTVLKSVSPGNYMAERHTDANGLEYVVMGGVERVDNTIPGDFTDATLYSTDDFATVIREKFYWYRTIQIDAPESEESVYEHSWTLLKDLTDEFVQQMVDSASLGLASMPIPYACILSEFRYRSLTTEYDVVDPTLELGS